MGVTGLWRVLDSTGKQINLESLESKVLSVDASILLNQAIKGMKDQPNAHLHVLFLRLCKLLTYKIKPIFVFDGTPPVLKRQTLVARQKRKEEASIEAESVANRLKRKTIQLEAVNDALGKPKQSRRSTARAATEADIFQLPPLPTSTQLDLNAEDDDYQELPIHQLLYSGDINLDEVDVNSEEFKSLPPEYQHEILEELKEHNRHNHEDLPSTSNQYGNVFSDFQVKKLVKSNILSNKIEKLRKVMIENMADHAKESGSELLQANRVLSEDTTHFVLVKNLLSSNSSSTGEVTEHQAASSPMDKATVHLPDVKKATETPSTDDVISEYFTRKSSQTNISPSTRHKKVDTEIRSSKVDTEIRSSKVDTEIRSSKVDGEIVGIELADIANRNPDEPKRDTSIPLLDVDMSESDNRLAKTGELNSSATDIQSGPTKNVLLLETASSASGDNLAYNFSKSDSKEDGDSQVKNSVEIDYSTKIKTSVVDKARSLSPLQNPSTVQKSSKVDEGNATSECLTITIQPNHIDNQQLFPSHLFSSSELNSRIGDADEAHATEGEHKGSFPHMNDTQLKDLNDTSSHLQFSHNSLYSEFQRQEALSQSVSQAMVDDAIELLRLFGVPYVLSPSEAEAQCAQLEELGLSDGTITDDSDIWLFGGVCVLKNFFQQDRFVLSFHQSDIKRLLGLDREKMVALALICGSDYTDGIPGAGAVTAMEIISEFDANDGLSALSAFKRWSEAVKANNGYLPASCMNSNLKGKLCKLVPALPESFPNRVVIDAYLKPSVDNSGESFDWGKPDLDLLRDFARRKLNWPQKKVDDLVCPVLKKLNSTESQHQLDRYFKINATTINTSSEFHSQRLKAAIGKLINQAGEDSDSSVVPHGLNKMPRPEKKIVKPSSTSSLSRRLSKQVNSAKSNKKSSTSTSKLPNKSKLIKAEIQLSEESSSDSE